jgi:mono/diheme cytochrome c family protein
MILVGRIRERNAACPVGFLGGLCATIALAMLSIFTAARLVTAEDQPANPAKPLPSSPRFSRDILPLLAENCFQCHGPDDRGRKAKLRLDTYEGATSKRGGGAAIVPGDSAGSELLRRILSDDPDEVMPPPATKKKLTPQQAALVRRWIDAGAPWGKHWAFEPPQRPALPAGKDPGWPRNPIDFFVQARLERGGMRPAPQADPAVLLRRVYLDLTGLPPTPEDVDAFLGDRSPLAYEKVVESLLASPHYGERWARPWLDAARYADSSGFQRDDLRDLWPYRDWVIQALNADMPFDQFTVEQLAGDLLLEPTLAQKTATGFHRCAPCNVEAGTDQEENRVNQVFDRVNTTATVWLGLTFECAQCHDHKYDPFTMRDYYGLFAYFNHTPQETAFLNAKSRAVIKFTGPYMALTPGTKAPADEQEARASDPQTGKQREPKHHERTLVMQELTPRMTHVLKRGQFLDPGERVEPATPSVVLAADSKAQSNRLGLARWLIRRDNPLTARVQVNRSWQELFGRGLVATPEDFGTRGELPTHPDLLDWLAVEFMEPTFQGPGQAKPRAWSMKHVHRLIVTSATYRQSSHLTPELRGRDDRNQLLARGPRLRLDAETIRDNALAIAGLLSRKLGGPPVRPAQPPGLWRKVGGEQYIYTVSPGEDRHRRGIYVLLRRSMPYPSFITFDATARNVCTVQRSRSNTPLQALTLLNDPVYVEAAQALAQRTLRELPEANDEARLTRAFRLCVARQPRPVELTILQRLLADQRAARQGQSDAELSAWIDVTSALLNLDETITKN